MSFLTSFFPNDEAAARAVMKEVHAREQAKLRHERKTVKSWGSGGVRGVRMPDGTQCTFRCPVNSYHYWGRREGYECWKDAGFVHEFLRDNPECRVTNVAERPLSGWTPASQAAINYRKHRQDQAVKAVAGQQQALSGKGLVLK